RLRFSGPKTSIICTPMTSLKTSIKTITYLSDTGCLEIQGASLSRKFVGYFFCMDKIIASKVCNNRECDEKSFITKPSWEREVFF
ncbi:hypothetical protein, partial [Shigella sonnei]